MPKLESEINFSFKQTRGISNVHNFDFNFSILEVDDAVGQVLAALKRNGIEDQTLIYFTSDHGAHIDRGTEGGSNRPFKGKYKLK